MAGKRDDHQPAPRAPRDRQMVTVPCPRKEREPEPRAASDLACRSQAARCKEMPFFSAAERSGEVPRLSQGIHGKVAAGPALRALMGSPHGGMEMEEEEEQRRRRRPAIALVGLWS